MLSIELWGAILEHCDIETAITLRGVSSMTRAAVITDGWRVQLDDFSCRVSSNRLRALETLLRPETCTSGESWRNIAHKRIRRPISSVCVRDAFRQRLPHVVLLFLHVRGTQSVLIEHAKEFREHITWPCVEGHSELVKALTPVYSLLPGDTLTRVVNACARTGRTQLLAQLLHDITWVKRHCDEAGIEAVENGHSDTLDFILSHSNERPTVSMLLVASELGHTRCVQVLLRHRVEVYVKQGSFRRALDNAVVLGHADTARLLMMTPMCTRDASTLSSALVFSSQGGHLPLMISILEHASREIPDGTFSSTSDAVLRSLVASADNGHVDCFRYLFRLADEVPSRYTSEALCGAAKHGHLEIVRLLLEDEREASRADPAYHSNSALLAAVEGHHTEVVRLLLTEPTLTRVVSRSSVGLSTAFVSACRQGLLVVVQLMMAVRQVDLSWKDNLALCVASQEGHLEIVRRLLMRVDAQCGGGMALEGAAGRGHCEVVRELLTQTTVRASHNASAALRKAAANGHNECVLLLLAQRIPADPSARNNEALRSAATNGHLSVLRTLLRQRAVDASAVDNAPLRSACDHGHADVVHALLASKDVNPSARQNECLRMAARNGHIDVVRLLLATDRVNVAARNHEASRAASRNHHTAVVRLLSIYGGEAPPITNHVCM